MAGLDEPGARDAQSSIALQGLRVLAPIGIMTNHWAEGLFHNLVPQEQICIDIFFMIEGLLAAEILKQTGSTVSFRKLMGDRLLKIYPLYLAGIALSLLLILYRVATGGSNLSATAVQEAFVLNMFFLPSFGLTNHVFPFNPPTWAIALEIYAFAVFCLMRRWITLARLITFTAMVTIAYVALAVITYDDNMGYRIQHYLGGYGRCLFGFCGGMLLYHIVSRVRPPTFQLNPLLIWTLFIALLLVDMPGAGFVLAIVGMPLLVWLGATASNPAWLEGFGQHAGRLSYGIYLLHYPMLLLFRGAARSLGISNEWLATPWYYLAFLAAVLVTATAATELLTRTARAIKRHQSISI
jgi:peptidoglycan/LPS O-acetylase OafA/YrhL